MSSPVVAPSMADVFNLLQATFTELASVKQSLAVLQISHNSLQSSNNSIKASIESLKLTTQSLLVSNESVNATLIQNHRLIVQEIEMLHNPRKKRYAQLSNLPREVVGQIMSWIHPVQVWKYWGLSKSFKELLSSPEFASLNLSQFVSHPTDTLNSSPGELIQWDMLFFNAPVSYQSVYAQKVLSSYSKIEWFERFYMKNPIPIAWLSHLKNLTILDLSCCALVGNIPAEIGLVLNLQMLDLSENLLSGDIPSTIGNLAHLKHLQLSENWELCGTIPEELCSLASLEYLNICKTKLMGPIPPAIVNLKNLDTLSLNIYSNPLSPNRLLPELGTLPRLRVLCLRSCNLVGTIPNSLGKLLTLSKLFLCRNNLEGAVPVELRRLNLEEFNSEGNPKLTFPFDIPEHWCTDLNFE